MYLKTDWFYFGSRFAVHSYKQQQYFTAQSSQLTVQPYPCSARNSIYEYLCGKRVTQMSGAAGAEDDFLEDYYDVIVFSTGLESSILAA